MNKINKSYSLLIASSNTNATMFYDINLTRFGYTVQTAHSSEEALQLASTDPPALIIADDPLKPQSAKELCWMMRQSKYLRTLPFVLLSDSNSPADQLDAV